MFGSLLSDTHCVLSHRSDIKLICIRVINTLSCTGSSEACENCIFSIALLKKPQLDNLKRIFIKFYSPSQQCS